MDFFASGVPVVNDGVDDHAGGLNSDTYINDDDTEVVAMIKEVRSLSTVMMVRKRERRIVRDLTTKSTAPRNSH